MININNTSISILNLYIFDKKFIYIIDFHISTIFINIFNIKNFGINIIKIQ